jgi:hypothetical protein
VRNLVLMTVLKSFLPLLLLTVTAFSCVEKAKGPDCALYKQGKFYIKANEDIPSFAISRTDSFQYETNLETGGTRVFSVRWTDPCEFELRLLEKPTDSATLYQSAFRDSIEKIPSSVRFIETADSYYIFEIRKKDFPRYIDTMWVNK